MFIFKTALPRRTVLRGMGATLALPFLEAMVPALTATVKTAANPPKRFGAAVALSTPILTPHPSREAKTLASKAPAKNVGSLESPGIKITP